MGSPTQQTGHAQRVVVPLNPGKRQALVVEPFPSALPEETPVVLLITGLGGAWFDWLPVARQLAENTSDTQIRVLTMDRPGVGEAPDWESGTTDLYESAADIVAALDAVEVHSALLVGHSMGAWYVEAAARLFPSRVSGLVLVDGSIAAVPRSTGEIPTLPNITFQLRQRCAHIVGSAADVLARHSVGWNRFGPELRRLLEGGGRSGVTPTVRALCRSAYARPALWRAALAEWAAYPYLAAQLGVVRWDVDLPDVPVTTITAVNAVTPALSLWSWMHGRQWRALNSAQPYLVSRSVTIHPAPHQVMLTHPKEVAAAIRETLAERNAE